MKNNILKSQENSEDFWGFPECICDDEGVHYICSLCGKRHSDALESLMCCSEDVEKE